MPNQPGLALPAKRSTLSHCADTHTHTKLAAHGSVQLAVNATTWVNQGICTTPPQCLDCCHTRSCCNRRRRPRPVGCIRRPDSVTVMLRSDTVPSVITTVAWNSSTEERQQFPPGQLAAHTIGSVRHTTHAALWAGLAVASKQAAHSSGLVVPFASAPSARLMLTAGLPAHARHAAGFVLLRQRPQLLAEMPSHCGGVSVKPLTHPSPVTEDGAVYRQARCHTLNALQGQAGSRILCEAQPQRPCVTAARVRPFELFQCWRSTPLPPVTPRQLPLHSCQQPKSLEMPFCLHCTHLCWYCRTQGCLGQAAF